MIELTRFVKSTAVTLGRLTYGNENFYTVERPWIGNKPFISCIPDGLFALKRIDSPKFGPGMWEIVDVLDRTHILLHVANTVDDVVGCVGIGLSVYSNLGGVGSSRKGIEKFYDLTSELTEETILIKTEALA